VKWIVYTRARVAQTWPILNLRQNVLLFHQLIFHQNTYLIPLSSDMRNEWVLNTTSVTRQMPRSNRNANWNAIIQQEIHTVPPWKNTEKLMIAKLNSIQQPICDPYSLTYKELHLFRDLFTLVQYRHNEWFHLCQIYNRPPKRTEERSKWAYDKEDMIYYLQAIITTKPITNEN